MLRISILAYAMMLIAFGGGATFSSARPLPPTDQILVTILGLNREGLRLPVPCEAQSVRLDEVVLGGVSARVRAFTAGVRQSEPVSVPVCRLEAIRAHICHLSSLQSLLSLILPFCLR